MGCHAHLCSQQQSATCACRLVIFVKLSALESKYVQIGGRQETAAYQILDLKPGHKIKGPAILIDDISTVVIEPECTAFVTAGRDIRVEVGETRENVEELSTSECDPIQLAIFSHR